MKSNTKSLMLILTAVFVGMLEVANAFYDPGTQRWLNRDPLGDIGRPAYKTGVLMPGVELRGRDEVSRSQIFDAWIAVNRNLYGAMGNNPIKFSDAFGFCPLANPMNAEAYAPGSTFLSGRPSDVSLGEYLGFVGGAVAAYAATTATLGVAIEALGPTMLGWLGLGGAAAESPQSQAVIEPMLAAITRNGQVITNPNLLLSHKVFADRALGLVGAELPPGTWVGTVGNFGGQIVGLNSMTFFGNQSPANPAVQQALQSALQCTVK